MIKMELLEGFIKGLKSLGLLVGKGPPVLLAVSGGVDSVVLARLFHRANVPFSIAHANFQLRGEESNDDERFVQKLSLELGVSFFVKHFETSSYAEQNGLSIQMAARGLRYAWFAELATGHGFQTVATAHHLNDSVETALLNFTRGTGLAGLRGMRPDGFLPLREPNGIRLLRPLLFATRLEIEAFAEEAGLQWREDSSNEKDDYSRNFVRHKVVPLLEALNPNFLDTAARNMRRLAAADDNLSHFLNAMLRDEGTRVCLDKRLLTQLPSPRQAIRQLLKPYGFDAEQTRQLAENLHHIGLEIVSSLGCRALVDREELIVEIAAGRSMPESIKVNADDLLLRLPDGSKLLLLHLDHDAGIPPPEPESALVDADKLHFPLQLRHWLPGDAFQPLGMGGKSQKLQDFFTNHKVSRIDKDRIWLLVNGDGLPIWVVGWRLDERFKIQDSTVKTLKFNWKK